VSEKSERKAAILQAHRSRGPSPTAHISRSQRERLADIVHRSVSAISVQGSAGRCYVYATACARVLTERFNVQASFQAGALLTGFCNYECTCSSHWKEMCRDHLSSGEYHAWVSAGDEVIDLSYRHTVAAFESHHGFWYGARPTYQWARYDTLRESRPHNFYMEDAATKEQILELLDKHEGAKEASSLALYLWDHPNDELVIRGKDCFIKPHTPTRGLR